MDTVIAKLTVYFQNPFWVCIYEKEWAGNFQVCKVTFGAQPRDNEVYEYFLKNRDLLKFSPSMATQQSQPRKSNPKRI